jgi:hypothetical protein
MSGAPDIPQSERERLDAEQQLVAMVGTANVYRYLFCAAALVVLAMAMVVLVAVTR